MDFEALADGKRTDEAVFIDTTTAPNKSDEDAMDDAPDEEAEEKEELSLETQRQRLSEGIRYVARTRTSLGVSCIHHGSMLHFRDATYHVSVIENAINIATKTTYMDTRVVKQKPLRPNPVLQKAAKSAALTEAQQNLRTAAQRLRDRQRRHHDATTILRQLSVQVSCRLISPGIVGVRLTLPAYGVRVENDEPEARLLYGLARPDGLDEAAPMALVLPTRLRAGAYLVVAHGATLPANWDKGHGVDAASLSGFGAEPLPVYSAAEAAQHLRRARHTLFLQRTLTDLQREAATYDDGAECHYSGKQDGLMLQRPGFVFACQLHLGELRGGTSNANTTSLPTPTAPFLTWNTAQFLLATLYHERARTRLADDMVSLARANRVPNFLPTPLYCILRSHMLTKARNSLETWMLGHHRGAGVTLTVAQRKQSFPEVRAAWAFIAEVLSVTPTLVVGLYPIEETTLIDDVTVPVFDKRAKVAWSEVPGASLGQRLRELLPSSPSALAPDAPALGAIASHAGPQKAVDAPATGNGEASSLPPPVETQVRDGVVVPDGANHTTAPDAGKPEQGTSAPESSSTMGEAPPIKSEALAQAVASEATNAPAATTAASTEASVAVHTVGTNGVNDATDSASVANATSTAPSATAMDVTTEDTAAPVADAAVPSTLHPSQSTSQSTPEAVTGAPAVATAVTTTETAPVASTTSPATGSGAGPQPEASGKAAPESTDATN
ncbi:uncharacterized protein MONBRDRAFT_8461 [Monosiga brevicollis MX1]|uniref:Uncharacterized protein n=1 Tax=Monosiga brevicollis TaxID=81824 RepID=A9V039_MONBE|nr:uncharacterized protein MONBRDRAFT_8461 [Monosiga brevicollis MX1]EDQ89091.1 predicted protein [Monosiga brevicollis MX1]|eukprot:XP_001746196.1 hypothetical protein [Monosiga brevicollis MX1]